MGFNVPNWGTIAAGTSMLLGYTFSGQDQGAQYAEGTPENPGGALVSDQEGIWMDPLGNISYFFTLTNIGNDTGFGLDGGGFS